MLPQFISLYLLAYKQSYWVTVFFNRAYFRVSLLLGA